MATQTGSKRKLSVNIEALEANNTLTLGGNGVATQAWVTDTVINAAPGALNTLNELAAALGDDANFSSTVTNNLATKLNLSGGTMTGALTISNNNHNNHLKLTRSGVTNSWTVSGNDMMLVGGGLVPNGGGQTLGRSDKWWSDFYLDGVLHAYKSDSEVLVQTYNTSATGNPAQFFISHNNGGVNIGNNRGDITISSGTFRTNGNTYLGNSNGDQTHINDTLFLGATDSGDSHFYFGENSSNWYGSYMNWDSGYRFSWYSRHAGTNSRFMYFDTNSTTYLNWERNFNMSNRSIHYVDQLHFNDNIRFLDEGNDSYLRFKYGDATTGGIKFLNGSDSIKGYVYADNSGFGLLSADGTWSVRTQNSETRLYHNTYFESNIYAYTIYDRNDTNYYLNPNGRSHLSHLTMPYRGNGTENIEVNSGGAENWQAIMIDGNSSDMGIGYSNSSHSALGRHNLSFHVNSGESIRFHSSGWDSLFEVAGGTGYGWLKGNLYVNGGQLRLSQQNTKDKIYLWGDDSNYTIGMSSGIDYGHIGAPKGNVDEFAMTFKMNSDPNRGFWWGHSGHGNNRGAMSLTTDGQLVVAKTLSIGEGDSQTAPSNTPLYVNGITDGDDVFAVDGVNGRLFTVTDDLSDSLFSVNTIAGLPIIEAFADQSIKLGPFTAPVEITSAGELKVDGGTDLGTAVTGATVSNDTITFTRANGSTFAVTTSDANTNTWRPIATTADPDNYSVVFYDSTAGEFRLDTAGEFAYDPSTGVLRAAAFDGALTGNAATATNADTVDGLHSSAFFRRDTSNDVNVRLAASDGRGLRFWDSDSYKIYMSAVSSTTWGGRVGGEPNSDYNMYFRMSGGTNRGFVFRNGTNNVAGIDASGNGRFEGDVVAYSASDRRLKDNIKPIENACEKVQKLTGYEFDWNENQNVYEGHDIGVVAQEVEEVFPEVVEDRSNGYKGVKYEKLVAVLIEANKELQDRVRQLEDKIDGLTK